MNILNSSYTWWQIGLLKLAVVCFGVAIGATWPEVFVEYVTVLIAVGIVLSIYLATAWLRKAN